jgi:hypothetical protein
VLERARPVLHFGRVPGSSPGGERRCRGEAAQAASCTHELGINEIKPGGSFQRLLELSQRYDMSRPGNYEITVTRETDPEHPEKSVTVKSNTITIVAKPEDLAPK